MSRHNPKLTLLWSPGSLRWLIRLSKSRGRFQRPSACFQLLLIFHNLSLISRQIDGTRRKDSAGEKWQFEGPNCPCRLVFDPALRMSSSSNISAPKSCHWKCARNKRIQRVFHVWLHPLQFHDSRKISENLIFLSIFFQSFKIKISYVKPWLQNFH